MIQINLLPEEFRIKESTAPAVPAAKIAAGLGALFVLVTAFFYIDYFVMISKQNKLETEWAKVKPQSQELYKLQNEVDGNLKKEKQFFETFVGAEKSLSSILTWVSEFLPETAWLTELKLDQDDKGSHLLIKGMAYSTQEKNSIEQIESYLNQLKSKMPSAKPSLTTTRQTIGETEVMNFVANFDWQSKEGA